MRDRSPMIEKLVAIPPFWRLVLSLIVAGTLLGVWLFAFVHNVLVSGEALPVALHSPLGADYSADAVSIIPAARVNLLRDAISDQVREGNQAPAEQLATMVDQMRTPVFTVTPYPGMTTTPGRQQPTVVRGTATPPPAPSQTVPVVPTQTVAVPTITVSATILVPSVTPAVTATRRYAITITPGFYQPTRTPTPTRLPATATRTAYPTATRSWYPTATHAPYSTATRAASPTPTRGLYPTAIIVPTKTPTPTVPVVYPSATRTTAPTSVPPTQTPVPPTKTLPPQQQPTSTRTQAPPTNTPIPATNTPQPRPTETPDDYPPPGTSYP